MTHKFKVGDVLVFIDCPVYMDKVLEVLPEKGCYKLQVVSSERYEDHRVGKIFETHSDIDNNNRLATPLELVLL